MPTLTVKAKRTQKTMVNEVTLLVKNTQDKNPSSSSAMDILDKNIDIYPMLTKSSVHDHLWRIQIPIPNKY